MTPAELKAARHALGLSAEDFARAVRLQSGRTVRKWEAGERDIPGPITVVLELADAVPGAREWLLGDRKISNCPRAKSDMTPCIIRDGDLALSDDGHCVGCGCPVAEIEELIGGGIERLSINHPFWSQR